MPKDTTSLSSTLTFDHKGIRLSWKLLLVVAAMIAGGGAGSYGLQAFFGASASADEIKGLESRNDGEHGVMRGGIEQCQETTAENSTAIKAVTTTVGKIESTQVRDIARKEARRLTDELRNRRQADVEYDRLFEQNLRRMSRGLDPCGSLACE